MTNVSLSKYEECEISDQILEEGVSINSSKASACECASAGILMRNKITLVRRRTSNINQKRKDSPIKGDELKTLKSGSIQDEILPKGGDISKTQKEIRSLLKIIAGRKLPSALKKRKNQNRFFSDKVKFENIKLLKDPDFNSKNSSVKPLNWDKSGEKVKSTFKGKSRRQKTVKQNEIPFDTIHDVEISVIN